MKKTIYERNKRLRRKEKEMRNHLAIFNGDVYYDEERGFLKVRNKRSRTNSNKDMKKNTNIKIRNTKGEIHHYKHVINQYDYS